MNQIIPPLDAYRGDEPRQPWRPEDQPAVAAAVQARRDQPQAVVYTREQKGHSLILHLTLGALVLWIPAIYFTISPRHFWHI